MGKPPGYQLSSEQLKAIGVDVERLEAGDHGQIPEITNQILLSLSTLTTNNNLPNWLGQLLGMNPIAIDFRNLGRDIGDLCTRYQEARKAKTVDQFLSTQAQFRYRTTDVPVAFHQIAQHSASLALTANVTLGGQVNLLQAENAQLSAQLAAAVDRANLAGNQLMGSEGKIAKLKNEIRLLKLQLMEHQAKLSKLSRAPSASPFKRKIDSQRKALARVVQCASCQKYKQRSVKLGVTNAALRAAVNDAKDEIDFLSDCVKELQEGDGEGLKLMEKGTYSPNVRFAVMKLVGHGVALAKVGAVLRDVLTTVVGVETGSVPSARTASRIVVEGLHLSQQQTAAAFASNSDINMGQDETTMRGEQALVTVARTPTGDDLIMGLREMPDKSAATTMGIIEEIFDDMERAGDGEASSCAQAFFMKVRSTQSDRAATCKLLDDLLDAKRAAIVDSLPDLSDDERASERRLLHFKCGLHLLANFATAINAALSQFQHLSSGSGRPSSQSNDAQSTKAVYLMCKVLSTSSKANISQHQSLCAYLALKSKEPISLANIRGNRFNIIFYDSGLAFSRREDVLSFIASVPSTPQLLEIQKLLTAPQVIAELKVLGLVGKTFTSPLWRQLESKCHIADMNAIYVTLLDWLEQQAADPSLFLAGQSPFLAVSEDDTFEALVDDSAGVDSNLVFSVASFVMKTLATCLRRLVVDHLPGGANSDLAEVMQETAAVPLTNKKAESAFGCYDFVVRKRPNSSVIINEATVLWMMNRTGDYFSNMPADERNAAIEKARASVPLMINKFKERHEQTKLMRTQKLQAKMLTAQKTFSRNEKLTAKIAEYGLWQSTAQLEAGLSRLPLATEQTDALKIQLQFRQKVLQQPAPTGVKSAFTFGKQSLEQLKGKVLVLIAASNAIEAAKPLAERQRRNPFIGKRIKHKFSERGNDGEWWNGYVINSVPGFPEWFNVVYEEEEEQSVYSFNLQADLSENPPSLTFRD